MAVIFQAPAAVTNYFFLIINIIYGSPVLRRKVSFEIRGSIEFAWAAEKDRINFHLEFIV